MTYPAQSNFRTAGANDAWWRILPPVGVVGTYASTCSMSGRSFVEYLQAILGVTGDGKWGPNTSSAIVAQMRSYGVPQVYIDAVAADARARRVGLTSMRAAIFLMHANAYLGDVAQGAAFETIVVSPDALLPQWLIAAPVSPTGSQMPSCVADSHGSPVTDGGGGGVPSVDIQVPPSDSLPTGTPPARQSGSSTPSGLMWMIGLGVVVVGLFALGQSKKKPAAARRNPYARRRYHR